jgi:hypothetical protein
VQPANLSLVYFSATNVAQFSFPGFPANALPDGNYEATLFASAVKDPSGNAMAANYVFDFYFLNGDANHDKKVDTLDFNALAANFGGTGKNYSQADFNYDGIVDTLDFNRLAAQFGKTLATAALQVAAPPPASREVFLAAPVIDLRAFGLLTNSASPPATAAPATPPPASSSVIFQNCDCFVDNQEVDRT